MTRATLPQRRHNETSTILFKDKEFRVTLGFFADEVTPGEVFVAGPKESELDAFARDAAILLSLCIQHGVPIETITNALTRDQDGTPSTLIGLVADRLLHKPIDEVPAPSPSRRDRLRQIVIEELTGGP